MHCTFIPDGRNRGFSFLPSYGTLLYLPKKGTEPLGQDSSKATHTHIHTQRQMGECFFSLPSSFRSGQDRVHGVGKRCVYEGSPFLLATLHIPIESTVQGRSSK